eukprot:182627-Rhodomonas_salina.1
MSGTAIAYRAVCIRHVWYCDSVSCYIADAMSGTAVAETWRYGPTRWLRGVRSVSYTHLTLPTICSV